MKLLIANLSTNETRLFDPDYEANEISTFLRKAIFDFLNTVSIYHINLPNGQKLVLDENSPEPIIWLGAALLYMGCVESGEWGDIVEIYKLSNEEEEDE